MHWLLGSVYVHRRLGSMDLHCFIVKIKKKGMVVRWVMGVLGVMATGDRQLH